jgi:hypothetical protein
MKSMINMMNKMNIMKYKNNRLYKYSLFNIFIKFQNTPNPHFIKFLPGRDILEEGESFDFANINQALSSPLARRLFEVIFNKYFR